MTLIRTNDPDFVKDDESGSVINTNINAYKLYKKNRNSQHQVDTLTNKVSFLEQELQEMKFLINKLVKGNHGNIDS